jgi:hypothetical protein
MKVIKISNHPKISREMVLKMGDSLFNNEEVDSVKIEVAFIDKSRLSYESGTKRKAVFDNQIDEMLEEGDEDD